MNERIQDLLPKPWTFPYPDRELYTKEQMEHFANQIIRECANIAREVDSYNVFGAGFGYEIAANIEQHFGVD